MASRGFANNSFTEKENNKILHGAITAMRRHVAGGKNVTGDCKVLSEVSVVQNIS